MKSEIKNLRKNIYNALKKKANQLEGKKTKELIEYEKEQVLLSKREFKHSNIDELIFQVMNAHIIYLGDFHTFDQNIRNALRVLKVLIQSKSQCKIALEMVNAQSQIYIDAFLENHITELEFLDSINYHDSWRFPWSHYQLIFNLAKENKIPIIALNTDGNLKQRDEFASHIISKAVKNAPNLQLLVIYGELHISPSKIPQMVSDYLEDVSQVIIHQNLDEVYWKLLEESESDNIEKVIKFNNQEFCINTAPPWIKYESMIYWFENLTEDPDFDIHEYIIENGKKFFGDDAVDNFIHMTEQMLSALKLEFLVEDIDDFNLFDHTRLDYIEDIIIEISQKELKNFYQELITNGFSFKIVNQKKFYCSSYSMNRLAYLAGIHIYHLFTKESNSIKLDFNQSTFLEEFFTLFAFEAMYAYFFSKVINPHRKCNMYLDFLAKKDEYHILLSIIDDGEMMKLNKISNNLFEVYKIAINIGHLLGEYLYQHVFSNKKIFNLYEELIKVPLNSNGFNIIRTKLLDTQDYKNHKKRYF